MFDSFSEQIHSDEFAYKYEELNQFLSFSYLSMMERTAHEDPA